MVFPNYRSELLDVGKQQLLPELINSLKDLPFLLCGPPGCGKKSLIQIAAKEANLKVKGAYDLGHIASEKQTRYADLVEALSKYRGRLQKNIMG